MTTEEFNIRLSQLREVYLGSHSNSFTEIGFRNAVSNLVWSLYSSGGVLSDELGIPIYRFEDVELDTSREPHSLNLVARRRPVTLDILVGVDGSVMHSYPAPNVLPNAYNLTGRALDDLAGLYGIRRNVSANPSYMFEVDASLRERVLASIRPAGIDHPGLRSAVICGATEEEFLHTLTLEVRRRFTYISPAQASAEAVVLLKEMLQGEGIEFGNSNYDWSDSAAIDLVAAYLE